MFNEFPDLLSNSKFSSEEISEKIRLFYVALTRAREKMILINPVSSKTNDYSNVSVLSNNIKFKYKSISDMINSVEFKINDKYKNIDIDKLDLSSEYNFSEIVDLDSKLNTSDKLLEVNEISIQKELIESKSFSKKSNKLVYPARGKILGFFK